MKILLLSAKVSHIAGLHIVLYFLQVIQRPANAIKEMVENRSVVSVYNGVCPWDVVYYYYIIMVY